MQSDPAKRPSVNDLMKHPTVQLRLKEKSIRDEYAILKNKEKFIDKKLDEFKQREERIKLREE